MRNQGCVTTETKDVLKDMFLQVICEQFLQKGYTCLKNIREHQKRIKDILKTRSRPFIN